MEMLLQPLLAAAVGWGLSFLPKEPVQRARLRAWLWIVPAAWAAIIGWALIHYDNQEKAPDWAQQVLWMGGPILVGLAAIVASIRTVSASTWFYALPFVVIVCGFAAYTWLLAYMSLTHAWF